MKKIAIIGAGPAGSTVAYVLSKHLSTNPHKGYEKKIKDRLKRQK